MSGAALTIVRGRPGTWQHALCVVCPGDESGHMTVNFDLGRWRCHRRRDGGLLVDLASRIGGGAGIVDMIREARKASATAPERPKRAPTPPPPFPPVREGSAVWEYLTVKRRLTVSTLRERGISEGVGRFASRAIFPCREAGTFRWVWFQGRAVPGASPAGAPRYLGPVTGEYAGFVAGPHETVMGLELHGPGTPLLVVCEGPISAAVVGSEAVATLGKGWGEAQARAIAALKPRETVVCFDRDVSVETLIRAMQDARDKNAKLTAPSSKG